MKVMKTGLIVILTVFISSSVGAIVGVIATEGDIARLKNDVVSGKIKVDKTRLKEIRDNYGEAPSVSDTDRRLVYDYGDLKIDFDKRKIWKDWEYDGFKEAVYTDDVDDLRYDLESKTLVGKNITYAKVRKDYGEPTESFATDQDGGMSVYYYGDIKMIFQNQIVVKSWRGKNLDEAVQEGPSGGALVGSSAPAAEEGEQ